MTELSEKLRARLSQIESRHEELGRSMSDPGVTGDRDRLRAVGQEYAQLEAIVDTIGQLRDSEKRVADARELQQGDDADLRDLAREDEGTASLEVDRLTDLLRTQLIPRDPLDDKNVIVEIRAGEGGEEAALFAGELYKMYLRYAERHRWKAEELSASRSEKGGYKEVIFRIAGQGAYSRLKFESGVHRVQRVPATEAQGRIHTSTATVAVLPEAEEVDIQINDDDLKIDVYRAGGKGGQGVNTTDSAVRITHLPTGEVVIQQDERSQLKNKAKAMTVLRARLFARAQEESDAKAGALRNAQIGRGERSEKMRTYNFPQDRLTDKRLGHNLSNLPRRMDGELDDLIEALVQQDAAERMAALEEGQE
ncbi:MAG: peptide chain release factor 1 [Chloroflexota bacterium]|jgi:peptide chain release factor 1|nr:peptide chain release factor 1 [Chloroflexota bacterium]